MHRPETYSAKELELGKSLVNHLKAAFKPLEFMDEEVGRIFKTLLSDSRQNATLLGDPHG